MGLVYGVNGVNPFLALYYTIDWPVNQFYFCFCFCLCENRIFLGVFLEKLAEKPRFLAVSPII